MFPARGLDASILRNVVLAEDDAYLRLWVGILVRAAGSWDCLQWDPEELGLMYLRNKDREEAWTLGRQACERFVAEGMVMLYKGKDGCQYAWLPPSDDWEGPDCSQRPQLPEPPFWEKDWPALHALFQAACQE